MSSRDSETDYGIKYYVPIEFGSYYCTCFFNMRVFVKENSPYKFKVNLSFVGLLKRVCNLTSDAMHNKIMELRSAIISVDEIKRHLIPYFENEPKESLKIFEKLTDGYLSGDKFKMLVEKTIADRKSSVIELHKQYSEYRKACTTFLHNIEQFYINNGIKNLHSELFDFSESEHYAITQLMSEIPNK